MVTLITPQGGKVLLKNRAWLPPRIGDESAGMLIGWFSGRTVDWRRVLATRVGRTVSVLRGPASSVAR